MSRTSRLWNILTLRCEAASLLSSRELDEALPFLDRLGLSCHVAVCRSCRRFRAQIRLIRRAVRRREELLADDRSAEGCLSPEARRRIALACGQIGSDDASCRSARSNNSGRHARVERPNGYLRSRLAFSSSSVTCDS